MTFIQGMPLCEAFYNDTVRPIIDRNFPRLKYSAGLLGKGSEVLGFDTEMSSDHDWFARVMLFLDADEIPGAQVPGSAGVLPGTRIPDALKSLIGDGAQPTTIEEFLKDYLAYDLNKPITVADWLTFPQQKLRTLTAGRLFHDDLGVASILNRFHYYPHDVWLYMLASAWTRIEQEEHLTGRAANAGDELGSSLISSRLVRDIMRLAFLMERQYAPYAKWFGTAFNQLSCAPVLKPSLVAAMRAETYSEREPYLVHAYTELAKMHNALNITAPLHTEAKQFFTRPFLVISMGAFSAAILEQIRDPEVRKIADRRPLGNIDLFSDSTDLHEDVSRREALTKLF